MLLGRVKSELLSIFTMHSRLYGRRGERLDFPRCSTFRMTLYSEFIARCHVRDTQKKHFQTNGLVEDSTSSNVMLMEVTEG